MKSNPRVSWINCLKGIGIILVVLGHVISKDMAQENIVLSVIRNIIYMVHMPLFFICAGYLFEFKFEKYSQLKLSEFFSTKARIYVIPYVTFSIFAWIITLLASGIEITRQIFENAGYASRDIEGLVLSLLFYINPVDNHLWFSYVMLLVLLLAFLFKAVNIKTLLIIGFGAYIGTWFFELPELIWKTARYFMLFQIGRIFFRINIENIHKKRIYYAITVFLLSFTGWTLLRNNKIYYPQSTFQIVAEVSGVIILVFLSKKMQNRCKWVEKLGKRTYPIYLMHQPFLVSLVRTLLLKLHLPMFVSIFLTTCMGILVPLFINDFIIAKSKVLRYLILGEVERSKRRCA